MVTDIRTSNADEAELLRFMRSRASFTMDDLATFCAPSEYRRTNFIRRLQREKVVQKIGRVGNAAVWTIHSERADLVETAVTGLACHTQPDPNNYRSQSTPPPEQMQPYSNPDEAAIWSYIVARDSFTARDVEKNVRAPEATRTRFIVRLRDTGLIRSWHCNGSEIHYTTKSERARSQGKAEKRRSLYGAIWGAIRIQRRFKMVDIHAALAPARPDLTERNLREYVKRLIDAGYVKQAGRSPKLGRDTPMILVKDTGPLPPEKRSVEVVIDGNSDKIVWAKGGRL